MDCLAQRGKGLGTNIDAKAIIFVKWIVLVGVSSRNNYFLAHIAVIFAWSLYCVAQNQESKLIFVFTSDVVSDKYVLAIFIYSWGIWDLEGLDTLLKAIQSRYHYCPQFVHIQMILSIELTVK